MASYHCSVKVGGKGQASGHAAYIAREGSYAERAGYEDLEATGYGNLPSWAEHEPGRFWTAADRHERANGATYREIEIALPRELNPDQRQALVLDFIQHEIGERHAHQWAIHNPGAALAGGEQPHAHLMYSERTVDGIERGAEQYFKRYNGKHPELGGCRKDSAGTEERLLETRQRWAEVQNAHLQQHGHAARVDHRSLADQSIDRAPEQHLGGRRVRQLAPDQREALLERRAAEDELQHSQRALAPFDLSQHLHALTAAATVARVRHGTLTADGLPAFSSVRRPPIGSKETIMDPQRLLATLIQLSDEQQQRWPRKSERSANICISMDGKGSWRDNVFVERLWRTVKYEEVYLKAYDSVRDARESIGRYLDFYNTRRPHSSLDSQTPDEVYFNSRAALPKAA